MQPRTSTKYIGGPGNYPRTAIYISQAIKAWHIETLSHRDLTAIVVKINNRETLILSVYLDYELKVVQSWLTAAMTFANHRGYAVIIGMGSCELYGLETNKRGEQLGVHRTIQPKDRKPGKNTDLPSSNRQVNS